jgi:hypothetical protein
VTKTQLRVGQAVILTGQERIRALVNLGGIGDDLIVADLYDRPTYSRPDHVAVKRQGRGLALGVALESVAVR